MAAVTRTESHSLLVIITAVVLVAVVIIQAGLRSGTEIETVGQLVIIMLTIGGTAFAVTRQAWGITTVVFPTAFVFWGLAPLVQIHRDQWLFSVQRGEILLTQAIVIAWLVAFLLAYRVGWRLPYRAPTLTLRITPRVAGVCWATSLVISLSTIALLEPSAFVTRSAYGTALGGIISDQVVGILFTFTTRSALLLALLPLAQRYLANGWRPDLFRCVVFLTPALVINSPLAFPRYWAFAMIFSGIIWSTINTLRSGLVLYFLTVGGILASSLVEPLRRNASIGAAVADFRIINVADYLTTVHFDSFQNIVYIQRYVEGNGHTAGEQLFGGLIFWFPRALWSGKPIDSGQLVYRWLDAAGYPVTFYNHAIPIPGTAWLDFGLIGVVIVGLVYGLTSGVIDDTLSAGLSIQEGLEKDEVNYLLVAAPLAVGLFLVHIRGSYYSTLAIIGYYAMAATIVYGFVWALNLLESS